MTRVSVDSSSLHLTVICPGLAETNHGVGYVTATLEPGAVRAGGEPYNQIKLMFHPQPSSSYWIWGFFSFDVSIVIGADRQESITPIGTVEPVNTQHLSMVDAWNTREGSIKQWELGQWKWRVRQEDVEQVERKCRDGSQNQSITIWLDVRGLCFIKPAGTTREDMGYLANFHATERMILQPSVWAELVSSVQPVPLPVSLPLHHTTVDRSWTSAMAEFERCGEALDRGDSVAAFRTVYDLLARLLERRHPERGAVTSVREPKKWRDFFAGLESENPRMRPPLTDRKEAFVQLFSALGDLANAFGHHGDQQLPPELEGMRNPLDTWEAEMFLSMEFLGAAYLIRRLSEMPGP